MYKNLTSKDKEDKVKSNLREHCKEHGAIFIHIPGGILSAPGAPDYIILTKNGLVIFCECKRPKGKLNPAQVNFKNAILANNGKYLLYDGLNDDELLQLLHNTSWCIMLWSQHDNKF